VSNTQTVLAFDYGIKRIGVAVGQTLTHTATALEILPTTPSSQLWAAIDRLFQEWQPNLFVLGKPVRADDSESPLFEAIKAFGNQLQARYNRDVHYIDERLSSSAASSLADAESVYGKRQGGKNKSRAAKTAKATINAIDHIAAKIILESWFRDALVQQQQAEQ